MTKVQKTRLDNGLTILIKQDKRLPQVSLQLWYNIGAKHEGQRERGMAHLIEHMIFKGTKKLSESDINVITHKLAGYSNAFTSHDFTSYIFDVPNNAWREPLEILADCMVNCTFKEQMLSSELMAVIQEMKMYRDDYQSSLIESLMAISFPEHPYHNPVIGYKHDLVYLTRDNLYHFYQQHYHPGNATLVIVGDVNSQEVLAEIDALFGHIKAQEPLQAPPRFFEPDLTSKMTTLYREVQTPWCCYAYVIPGLSDKNSYLFEMLAMILGSGKSSRLYQSLVNKERVATTVECFTYDMFEKGLLFIAVQPTDEVHIHALEEFLNSQIYALEEHPIEDWEFERVRKMTQLEHAATLQDYQEQATIIGSTYLATGNKDYLDTFLNAINKAKKEDIQQVVQQYVKKTLQLKGYLLPIHESDKELLEQLQEESDSLDNKILSTFTRTLPVEPAMHANNIPFKSPVQFTTPRPEEFKLTNGMTVLFLNMPDVLDISLIFNLQTDYLYDPPALSGIAHFLSKMLLLGTKNHTADELNKLLEIQGIIVSTEPGALAMQMLPNAFEPALDILLEMLREPALDRNSVENVRTQILSQLNNYWDTPYMFIDQFARELVYKDHPYAKNSLGTMEGISAITQQDLRLYHEQTYSPDKATLVIVGNLSRYTPEQFIKLITHKMEGWQGKEIPSLEMIKPAHINPTQMDYYINRDQVVLGLVAPSIERKAPEYNILALLDVVLSGGATLSMSSRLFSLREQTGLFYTIFGSLIYGARQHSGMLFTKTIVSLDKLEIAEEKIKHEIEKLGELGITKDEFEMARNALLNESVNYFETTAKTAKTFLFLKKYELGFDLFDKQHETFSSLSIQQVNKLAKTFCQKHVLSVIRIGRIKL